jgi:hypothetical protein
VQIEKIHNFRPLLVSTDYILGINSGRLARYNYETKKIVPVHSINLGGLFLNVVKKIRFMRRLLRLDPSCAISLDASLFFVIKSTIFRYNLSENQLDIDFIIPDGRKCLNLSIIRDSSGQEKLAFGEYFSNPSKDPVRLWIRDLNGWRVLNQFDHGEIEHVHNIVEFNDKYLVLTGDFNSASGIWDLDPDGSELILHMGGEQKYRACWMWPISPNQALYGTDSQLEQNHLMKFTYGLGCEVVDKLPGSCIYYSIVNENTLLFSCTVEPGMPTGSFWIDVFETLPGPGIEDSYAHVYICESSGRFRSLISAEKDVIPLRLGQFGSFMFPLYDRPYISNDSLVVYANAIKYLDDCCLIINDY